MSFTHASADGKSVSTHGEDLASTLACPECRPIQVKAIQEVLADLSLRETVDVPQQASSTSSASETVKEP